MVKKTGFTLIELLVVIAIIALLMSILMPGLKRAKEMAASILCLSNQKQMALAYSIFPQDNDDQLVDAFPKNSGFIKHPVNGKEYATFVAAPSNEEAKTLDGKIESFRRGGLWPYLGTHKVFNCSFDRRWKNVRNNGTLGGYRSYSIGEVLSRFYVGKPKSQTGAHRYAISKYSEFQNPASKFVFVEETSTNGSYNGAPWAFVIEYNNSPWWYDSLAANHNDASTFGYGDGHAEKYKWTDKNFLELCRQGGDWSLPRAIDVNSDDYYKIRSAYIPGRRRN